jgi:hypothetical protein
MTTLGKEKMKATFLTHQVSLGVSTLAANQIVQIEEHSSFNGQLFISLAMPALKAKQLDMRLWWCLLSGDNHYCIVAYPRSFDDDQPKTALMVLKVIDQNTLATIAEEEFQAIEKDCASAVASWPRAKEDAVCAVLGNFPETEI